MQIKKILSIMLVCALMLVYSAAVAGPVIDTGDKSERTCNPHSYTDLGNGIIKDNVTGLMWQKAAPPGTYTWQQAVDYCDNLVLGGYTDWYLPTVKDLSTLVDSSIPQPGPTINTAYFPNTEASYYWSSTRSVSYNDDALYVYFKIGYADSSNRSNLYYVRAVRSGQ